MVTRLDLTDDSASGSDEAAHRYAGAVNKVARVLELLEDETWLGASDIAAKLNVDRSTAHRLAKAMTRLGWLRQDDETKRYRLGLRLWELGTKAIADLEVRTIALPYMRDVVEQTGESCDLAVLDGGDIVYIEKVDGTHEVRAYTRIGQRVPAHAVAMGKALMSNLTPDERARRLPRKLTRFTSKTVGSLEELDLRCTEVLRLGYAVNVGEHNPEAGGLAVPIRDRTGDLIAAIGINVPAVRMTEANVLELAPILMSVASAISTQLGYAGTSPTRETNGSPGGSPDDIDPRRGAIPDHARDSQPGRSATVSSS